MLRLLPSPHLVVDNVQHSQVALVRVVAHRRRVLLGGSKATDLHKGRVGDDVAVGDEQLAPKLLHHKGAPRAVDGVLHSPSREVVEVADGRKHLSRPSGTTRLTQCQTLATR